MLLKILASKDDAVFKAIEKRIARESELNPILFNRLLPKKRTGFRKSKKKTSGKSRAVRVKRSPLSNKEDMTT